MNERLQQFLSAENISQSQLAERIGVARASISHILSGRNRPGFDFMDSMARNFPALNLDWLITGRGRMYKTLSEGHEEERPAPVAQDGRESLFSTLDNAGEKADTKPDNNTPNSYPTRITVFYSDGRFKDLDI
ncbi:MAG: helix-turn-helix domain-containing protein [Bacteroidales bacterium]|nr:helix-turn-helix domain-containing protein [Bacteroidales bacterium]